MDDHDKKIDKFCATAAQSAMVGMVISWRTAKACDVCGKERARWYCAADLAYLCERCDGAVHSANPVACRHERTRLGANGAPVKKTQASAGVDAKRDAPTVVTPNPRKRPRSIRRHKPSSFYASKHLMSSSIHTSKNNHVLSHASSYSNYTGSILASTQGVMIDNPRSNPDFIANFSSSELLSKSITSVKAEPYSPVDIGDQVRVPDYLDDDHLLECLFDFTDLHDDDLCLHQVPIYDPRQSQDLASTIDHSAQGAEGLDYEEEKPIINTTSPSNAASEENLECADFHSPELLKVEEGEGVSIAGGSTEVTDDDPASLAECENETEIKNTIDLNNEICDLDQLDFDCVLHGDDDDSDEMDHSASMDIDLDMDVDMTSHDFMDVYSEHATTEVTKYAEASFNCHGNCNLNDSDGSYDGEHHASYHASGFDFNTAGGESPHTWLSKVKEESPPELEFVRDQHGDVCDDALLREKLTCKTFSTGSLPSAFKLGLKLNFEDVLSSWSDRGSFWKDGYRPSQIASCLDFLGGCFVPEMNVPGGSEGEGQQLVSALSQNKLSDSAREASVLRYREKRRTRLFSKKIRYEVRKLNAEKRPRMKGRFVKRMTI
ncbi:hypothetical protein L7F22_002793 [Adiantum nelumboides]|nr:hypothetical protein [Adiantum nelumboides]